MNVGNVRMQVAIEMTKNLAKFINENKLEPNFLLELLISEVNIENSKDNKKSTEEKDKLESAKETQIEIFKRVAKNAGVSIPDIVDRTLWESVVYNGTKYNSGYDLITKFHVPKSYVDLKVNEGFSLQSIVDQYTGNTVDIPVKGYRKSIQSTKKKKDEDTDKKKRKRTPIQKVEFEGTVYPSAHAACGKLGLEYWGVMYYIRAGKTFSEAVECYLNSGKKKTNENRQFIYRDKVYKNFSQACIENNVLSTNVKSYSYRYNVPLATAFGILIGDLDEKEAGLHKREYKKRI